MTSPAQRHFARVSAALQAAAQGAGATMAGASRYELMLAKLATDRRRLKEIESTARKVDVKREVLPEYADYVAGILEGGQGAQDDVLVTVMVWRIDAGDYAGAMPIAEYALKHELKMPDQFERSLACAVVEEMADAALRSLDADTAFDAEVLAHLAMISRHHDMPDQVRAKLLKAYAKALLFQAGDIGGEDRPKYETALEVMRRAVELNDRVGCKKDIAALERALAAKADGGDAGGQ